MRKRTNLLLAILVAGLFAGVACAASQWGTDFEEASAESKASNRYMLLDFSGSDWCGWCIKLEEEVFSKKAFKAYADANLICVLLDFPRGTRLKKSIQEQNTRLAKEYGVRGYPTVLVLSPSGELVGKTGYKAGGPEEYVEHLKSIIDPHREQNGIAPVAGSGQASAATSSKLSVPKQVQKTVPEDKNREARAWTSKNGTQISASLVKEMGSYAVLKKEDGTTVQIPKTRLSADDQAYIESLKQ